MTDAAEDIFLRLDRFRRRRVDGVRFGVRIRAQSLRIAKTLEEFVHRANAVVNIVTRRHASSNPFGNVIHHPHASFEKSRIDEEERGVILGMANASTEGLVVRAVRLRSVPLAAR